MITCHGDTHLGRRDNNEDSFWPPDDSAEHILFAVADGMGGAQAGEVASRIAIEHMQKLEREMMDGLIETDNVESLLRQRVEEANEAVCDESDTNPDHRGLATTLTAAVVSNERCWYVHVGDTRLYRLRAGRLDILTKDHTVAHLMLRRGHITREDYEQSPMKHNLTSRVGMDEGIDIQTGTEDLAPDDRLLICSDGLWDAMTDDDVRRELAEASDPKNAVDRLLELALANQTEDNATAVVVFVGE